MVLTITYLFFLVLFLPKAFSNIPFKVAPDLVAPSPNFATRLFSSSICAALTLNLIFLFSKSSSVIFASNAFPGEKTSGLASAEDFAKSDFLIDTIIFFHYLQIL